MALFCVSSVDFGFSWELCIDIGGGACLGRDMKGGSEMALEPNRSDVIRDTYEYVY